MIDLNRNTGCGSSPLPRRLVLLTIDGSVDEVLCVLPASCVQGEIRHMARMYPGRVVAGEWLGPLGWVRFLLAGFPRDPEFFSEDE